MYTNLNVGQMLQSVTLTLQRVVLPELQGPDARAKAEMCVAILEWVRHALPTEQQRFAREAHEMLALYEALASAVATDASSEAVRVQERAARLRAKVEFPVPVAYETLLASHRELSEALIATLDDVHALDGRAHPAGPKCLALLRAHLSERAQNDLNAYLGALTTEAMVGRESGSSQAA